MKTTSLHFKFIGSLLFKKFFIKKYSLPLILAVASFSCVNPQSKHRSLVNSPLKHDSPKSLRGQLLLKESESSTLEYEIPEGYQQSLFEDKHILLIGDSHVTQTFGSSLDLLLRSTPHTKVKTIGSCGVKPEAYMSGQKTVCGFVEIENQKIKRQNSKHTPLLKTLIENFNPDLVVVALGANLINKASSNPLETKKEISLLIEKISETSACVWIGPPYGLNQQKPFVKMEKLYSLLEEVLPEKCRFLDSRPQNMPFLNYRELAKVSGRWGDGRHFDQLGAVGKHAARQWALKSYDFIKPSIREIVAHKKSAIGQDALAAQLLDYDQ